MLADFNITVLEDSAIENTIAPPQFPT